MLRRAAKLTYVGYPFQHSRGDILDGLTSMTSLRSALHFRLFSQLRRELYYRNKIPAYLVLLIVNPTAYSRSLYKIKDGIWA